MTPRPRVIRLKEHVDMDTAKKALASKVLSRHDYHKYAEYLGVAQDGWVAVDYTKTDYGRYQSRVRGCAAGVSSCTTMVREIRNHLFSKYGHDIDICNSQPTIMSQTYLRHGIATTQLNDYNLRRDERLQELQTVFNVTKAEAKELIILLCNQGKADAWAQKHSTTKPFPEWVRLLETELHTSSQTLLERRPDLQRLNKWEGSQIAVLYFHEESRCLDALYAAVKKSKYKVLSLIYDGLHVERKEPGTLTKLPLELLHTWENAVYDATGYTIRLSEKEMELNLAFISGEDADEETLATTSDDSKPLGQVVLDDEPLPGALELATTHTVKEIKKILEQTVGFKDVRFLDVNQGTGWSFDADRSCACPLCCIQEHGGSKWYVMTICPQLFAVRSHATKCKQRLIGFETHRQIQDILQTPDTDDPYVSLFQTFYGDKLMWTGTRFMMYEGHRWHATSPSRVYNTISMMSMGVLERLLEAFGRKMVELDSEQPTLEIINEKKKIQTHYESTAKGIKYVRKHSNLHHFLEMAKNKLIQENTESQFDHNPWLLGTNNGIIDMKDQTWTFRNGTPDDMVSRTVGYNFSQKEADLYKTEVQAMFDAIYPIGEEQELVQRYLGYCLIGYHPEKRVMLLTDARGGNNGKSTIGKVMTAVMGDEYSTKPMANFLYRAERAGNINSHAAGVISFLGTRVAFVEELDPKYQLDVQFLKDINGGRTSFSGRAIGKADIVKFEWVTKQVLAFNGGNMPRFDVGDSAFLKRIMVIQHRAKFCLTDAEYEREKFIPNTHRADPDIDDSIKGKWRSALLVWCLEGLKRYRQIGFRVIPAACQKWTQELANEQDLVRDFIMSHFAYTGNQKEYVVRSQLYQEFKLSCPEERDKRTCIGKSKFLDRIKSVLGEANYKEQHGKERLRDCFLGWSRKNYEGEDMLGEGGDF